MISSSIKAQMILLVLFLNLTMMVMMVGLLPYKAKSMGNDLVEDSSALIAELLATDLGIGFDAMILDDGASIRQSVDNFINNDPQSVRFIQVFDQNNNSVYASGNTANIRQVSNAKKPSDYTDELMVISQVVLNNQAEQVGLVKVAISKEFLNEKTLDFSLLSLLVSGIIFLVSLIVVRFLHTSITQPLNNIVNGLQALGKGKLNHKINLDVNNEIGRLALDYQELVDKLNLLIGSIYQSTHNVDAKADDININLNDLTAEFASQKSRVSDLVSRVEDISIALSNNAEQSGLLADKASDSAKIGDGCALSVGEIVNKIEVVNNMVRQSVEIIQGLGERSREIEDFLAVINDISEQTNLLALNAAIEAARAGDHGRGFAVVADEVRGLSRKTRESSDKIKNLVMVVLEDIHKAAEAVAKSRDEVTGTVQEAKIALENMKKMSALTFDISEEIKDTSQETDEHSKTIHKIHQVVESYNEEVTNSNTAAINKTLDTFMGLKAEIENLKHQESNFET